MPSTKDVRENNITDFMYRKFSRRNHSKDKTLAIDVDNLMTKLSGKGSSVSVKTLGLTKKQVKKNMAIVRNKPNLDKLDTFIKKNKALPTGKSDVSLYRFYMNCRRQNTLKRELVDDVVSRNSKYLK